MHPSFRRDSPRALDDIRNGNIEVIPISNQQSPLLSKYRREIERLRTQNKSLTKLLQQVCGHTPTSPSNASGSVADEAKSFGDGDGDGDGQSGVRSRTIPKPQYVEVGARLAKAAKAESSGDGNRALTIYGDILRDDAVNVEAHSGVARIYRSNGDYERAAAHLRRVLHLYTNSRTLAMAASKGDETSRLGMSLQVSQGKGVVGIPLEVARSSSLSSSMGRMGMGMKMGTTDRQCEALNALGSCLRSLKRYKDAILTMKEASARLTSSVSPLLELGKTYLVMERANDAKNAFLEALNRDPKHRLARSCLGIAALQLGQTDFAEKQFKMALSPQETQRKQRLEKQRRGLNATMSSADLSAGLGMPTTTGMATGMGMGMGKGMGMDNVSRKRSGAMTLDDPFSPAAKRKRSAFQVFGGKLKQDRLNKWNGDLSSTI